VGYRRFRFKHKETSVTVLAEDERFFKIAIEAILEARREIEAKIREDPLFLTALDPYDCSGYITGRMCMASRLAGVGPMASVAGVIAQHAVERMVDAGASFAVVDNGGDIAMFLDRPITVGVFTYSTVISFRVKVKGFYAVCTSSGTIGHSLSFGFADAATIFARDACIADAFATALCNTIKEDFDYQKIREALNDFWNKNGKYIDGVLVIKENLIGFAGDVPEIVRARVNPDLITRG